MLSRSFGPSHWSRRPSIHNEGHPAHSLGSGLIGEENPQIDQPLFLHMPGDQLRHLKHADLLLAVEHGFQRLVSIDEGLLFCILQPTLADISPKLFRQLRPWKRFVANNFGERLVRRDRFHECCIRCSFRFFWCFSHAFICLVDARKAILIFWCQGEAKTSSSAFGNPTSPSPKLSPSAKVDPP